MRINLPEVVLVRGCPRSGTTLVAELINASPDAAILVEYPLGNLLRDLAPILVYGKEFRAHRRAVDGSRDALPRTPAQATRDRSDVYPLRPVEGSVARFPTEERMGVIVASVVAASMDKGALRVVGSKTPGYAAANDRAALEKIFPTIKYVFLVRNPLDTINSMINRRNLTRMGADTFAYETVDACIGAYRENARQILSHAAAFPGACFVLKFEDLLESFDDTAARLGEFLGLRFDADAPSLWGQSVRPREHTTRDVLTDDEREAVEDAFGPAIAAWQGKRLTGPGELAAAALHDCVEEIEPDVKIRYGGTHSDRIYLGIGWSAIEETGVWSDGERADLVFRVPRDGSYTICTEATYFLPEERAAMEVALDVDGDEAFRATFIAGAKDAIGANRGRAHVVAASGPKTVMTGPHWLDAGSAHRLTLHFREPRSPQELGISDDSRRMAAMLHGVLFVTS